MQLPSRTALLLNGAAILVAGASMITVIRSVLVAEDVPSCKERFATGTRLSLDRDGTAITTADLQGRLGNTDWGLLHGAQVVKLRSGPAKFALEIDLASAPGAVQGGGTQRVGIGFNWAPQNFGKARAACLTYSVFLPEEFTFGRGGRLPGLVGNQSRDNGEGEPVFSTRYTWLANGDASIHTDLPGWPEGRPLTNERNGLTLEKGRWIELEQEVVLNAPGKKDGQLRVWRDGRIVLQKNDLVFRNKASELITGVLAEVVAGEPLPGTKPGPQKIWITPFELRWQ